MGKRAGNNLLETNLAYWPPRAGLLSVATLCVVNNGDDIGDASLAAHPFHAKNKIKMEIKIRNARQSLVRRKTEPLFRKFPAGNFGLSVLGGDL